MTNVWPGGQIFGIWAAAIGTRFAPIPNAANRRPAPKSKKSAAVFQFITLLPNDRPREPEMTARQNRTRQRPYHIATAGTRPRRNGALNEKGVAAIRRLRPSV